MDPRITHLTSAQLGLVTRRQLTQLDLSYHAVDHLIASGRLRRLTSRVLGLRGAPVNDHTRALCAVLDADGFLFGRSSAALWGAPGYSLIPAHVVRRRGGRTGPGHFGVVHTTRRPLDEHATTYCGIPVLTPARTVFDLAATEHPDRVRRTLDWFWSRRLVTIPRLEQILGQLCVQGRSGIVLMRELISERRDLPPPDSNLELRFEELVRRADLPPFTRQVDLGNGTDWAARVDFVASTRLLVIEIDSEIHHSALSDLEADAARRAALEAAGFMVRSLDENDMFHQSNATVAKLRRWHEQAPSRSQAGSLASKATG